ncbi:MAG: hypothetical protein Q4E46_02965 [Candidatus Saccharibacteria bacterium]|nr:hypothetical protein [Candidatus Saccharibacteria bacterium]
MNTEWISLIVSIIISVAAAIATSFLTLGKYKEKVDQLEKRGEKDGNKINDVEKAVVELKTMISSLEKNIDRIDGVAQSHSPLSLTEKGKKLIKDSGLLDIFDKIKDDLVKDLEKEKPISQYDTQEKARMLMTSLYSDRRFTSVEKWAYENGRDFAQILRAGSIPLRDYYFEKHPEIVNPKEQY